MDQEGARTCPKLLFYFAKQLYITFDGMDKKNIHKIGPSVMLKVFFFSCHPLIQVPLVIDEWSITSQLNRDHSFVIKSKGWQNITFASRLYNNAFSKLYLQ